MQINAFYRNGSFFWNAGSLTSATCAPVRKIEIADGTIIHKSGENPRSSKFARLRHLQKKVTAKPAYPSRNAREG